MKLLRRAKEKAAGGFLGRLARDRRGNVIAIMAAAIFPLIGMVGGGLDLSRMYITKTRLQHACDAGALAGRRTMGAGSWVFNNNAANAAAVQFFNGNWQSGSYGSEPSTVSFSEADGVVTGIAQAALPMTLMRVFGQPTRTIEVTCGAEQRLLNTDVMFVLDTTGSMAFADGSGTRMDSLRRAVKCFYQVLAQLNITDQACQAGEPSGGIDPNTQLRFGFVPYSSNVNVGRLLQTDWMPDSWTYQTRKYQNSYAWSSWRKHRGWSPDNRNCPKPDNTAQTQWQGGTAYWAKDDDDWRVACERERRDWWPVWTYGPIAVNISGLKNGAGASWNASFTVAQLGDNLETATISWDGCIEERKTIFATDYDPIPAGANDLDIDMLPTSADPATQWGPVLPQLHYWRNVRTGLDGDLDDMSREPITTSDRYYNGALSYGCPSPSRKLRSYQASGDPANFMNYVNSLNPVGGTYHDIGMIWGQRLLSPTGIFAAENRATPSGGNIERHLIFMTDGDTDTSEFNSGPYGLPWYDRRHLDPDAEPNAAASDAQVNLRFEGLCERGKGPFTIWVIGFGPLTSATQTRLNNCASPGRYFHATDGAQLENTFRQIAEQIGQLRLRQ